MSDPDRCPHHPQLVSLLGRDADGELRRHLGTCAECQAELALLRAGFAALGDDLLGADEHVQQRIAAQVMPQILSELARAPVVAAPAKAQPGRPRLPRLVLFGALTTLAVVPAALYWMKLGSTPLKPVRALGLALLPLVLLPAAVLGSPTLRRATLAGAIGLTAALMLSTVDNLEAALQGTSCLLLGATGSLLPALVVLRAATKEHAGALSGALLGTAIASGGAALQRLLCGLGDLSHTLVFHLGPFLFLIALAGLLGSWVAWTTAPPAATPYKAA